MYFNINKYIQYMNITITEYNIYYSNVLYIIYLYF